jgi:hypothetical protein
MLKNNLKTFWDDFSLVPVHCKDFSYIPALVACRNCPHSHACHFLHDLKDELQAILFSINDEALVSYDKRLADFIKEILGEAE